MASWTTRAGRSSTPQGAGRYDVSMEHKGTELWRQLRIDLQAGEQRVFDVTW
ncbi:MAG TPA: hypothetical protein VIG99_11325 [Myxococcaceae bacterium]